MASSANQGCPHLIHNQQETQHHCCLEKSGHPILYLHPLSNQILMILMKCHYSCHCWLLMTHCQDLIIIIQIYIKYLIECM